MKLHHGRFYILFSKGWVNAPDEKYWDCLKLIASKYSGIDRSAVTERNIYNHTESILSKLKTITFVEWNDLFFENATMNRLTGGHDSQIQLMVRTNLSFLSRITNIELGGREVIGGSDEEIQKDIEELMKEL